MAKRPGGSKRSKPKDIALIVDRTEDREGFQVLRRRGEDQPIELGTLRPLRDGKPIEGEVVSLRPREDHPFVCDVHTELDARRATAAGPAQVASDDYRKGWDTIWGDQRAVRSSAKLN